MTNPCKTLMKAANEVYWHCSTNINQQVATLIAAPVCQPEATRHPLTHDEEEGADEHSAREHVLRAGLLARRFAHRAQLVGERVRPEVGQQESAEEEGQGAVAGAPRRLHLGAAHGLHIELQDGHGEDDHPERQDEGRPRLHFALRTSTTRVCAVLSKGLKVGAVVVVIDF